MKAFLPVLAFVIVSFFLLEAWINYSNPDLALRPLLYQARIAAWIVALSISTLVFLRAILQRRLQRRGATWFAAISIMLFYPCDAFLTAHAEERVIRQKTANRDPHDDMGPSYLYGSFSPGAGGTSGGASDAKHKALGGFTNGLIIGVIWLPLILLVSRLVYRHSTSLPNVSND